MRTLLSLLLAFAMATSQALAFENGSDPVGKVYLSIPFGGSTRTEAMPRVGFRIDHGYRPSFAQVGAGAPASLLDWRLDFDGQTNLRLNGVDMSGLARASLGPGDEDPGVGDWVYLGLVLVGIGGIAFSAVLLNDLDPD